MTTPDAWQKSSFSGGGQGDACVQIARRHTHIAIRDSKTPSRATLTFPTGAFAPSSKPCAPTSPGSAKAPHDHPRQLAEVVLLRRR